MIPEDISRFILTSIPSVPHLEAILLFHRMPGLQRTRESLAQSLYLSEAKTAAVLDDLVRDGIIAPVPGSEPAWRFQPRNDSLRSLVERLAAVYAADVIGVSQLIHDAVAKNAHRFADAFRLRRDR